MEGPESNRAFIELMRLASSPELYPPLLAGTVGLEPTTTRLTAERSTIELHAIMAEDGVPDTHSLATAIRLASGAETLSVHLPCGQGDWA